MPGSGASGAPARRRSRWLLPAVLAVVALAVLSTFVGVASVTPAALLRGDADAWQLLAVSRLPRTAALILVGVSLAVAGLVMQLLVRNRFVDPSTSGAVDASMLGLLAVMIVAPGMPVIGKMLVAALFALAGTGLFLLLLSRMPLRSPITVPLVGITFGGVLGAAGSFVAYEQDLIQSMLAWRTADFSGLLAGRYELLWVAAALAVVVWFLADRLTIAGLGQDAATGLGLSYRTVMITGMVVVSLISATVTATVGDVPFLGLIVPNVVSLLVGDHARRSVPWVALLGAGFLLLCDVIGRLVRYPYEVPLGVVVGVLGSAAFLYLLVKGSRRVG